MRVIAATIRDLRHEVSAFADTLRAKIVTPAANRLKRRGERHSL